MVMRLNGPFAHLSHVARDGVVAIAALGTPVAMHPDRPTVHRAHKAPPGLAATATLHLTDANIGSSVLERAGKWLFGGAPLVLGLVSLILRIVPTVVGIPSNDGLRLVAGTATAGVVAASVLPRIHDGPLRLIVLTEAGHSLRVVPVLIGHEVLLLALITVLGRPDNALEPSGILDIDMIKFVRFNFFT